MRAYERAPGLRVLSLEGETVVYLPERKKVFVLNASAGAIFELCDGQRAEDDIARQLSREFREGAEARVAADVRRTVDELSQLGLVVRT